MASPVEQSARKAHKQQTINGSKTVSALPNRYLPKIHENSAPITEQSGNGQPCI